MVERIFLKARTICHYIFHSKLYHNKVILMGVPRLLYPEKIKFGRNIRINDTVFLHAKNGIVIGDNTTLSYGASIITESYDITSFANYIRRNHGGAPIVIGGNVWIGASSIILPGIKIEDNIIVGAGSVVTRNLTEQFSIYAGNPARFIRKIGAEI